MRPGHAGIALHGRAHVLFTDRSHGNLSSVGGERSEHGAAARERLRELIGVRRLARGYQVHGTVVERLRELPGPEPFSGPPREADGQASALAGVGVMVLSADCLLVALACEGGVAMVHAGWRGLAAGVLEEGVRAMRELNAGGEIVAMVGPGAGPCCYEVGPEVHAALTRGPAGQEGQAGGRTGGQAHAHARARNIDLRAIAHERLLSAGVGEVRHVDVCTICDERYFSHRREGARAGRQAGVAWLS